MNWKNILIIIYLIIIYCWIPIEIQLFKFISWNNCSNYFNGKYLHYILLIILQGLGLIFSIKNKRYIMTAFIALNFFFFIVLYSVGDSNVFNDLGYICVKEVN